MTPGPQAQSPGHSPMSGGEDDRVPPGREWAWSVHDHVYYFRTARNRVLYTTDRAFIDYVFAAETFDQLELCLR